MRVSREQMAANHASILDEASRLFRERGFDAVTVADVMKAAGLTHGGFYGHFRSKNDLIAEVLGHVLSNGNVETDDLAGWKRAYLSPVHRDSPAQGCPVAGLAGLMRLQTDDARTVMAKGVEAQINRLAELMPGDSVEARRRAAIGLWSAMVGALVLSRAVGETALAEDLLSETRQWLDAQDNASESAESLVEN